MKASSVLRVGSKDFHVVAAVLMMLGLLEGYLQFQDVVPNFAGEVAHRVVELLKVRIDSSCMPASLGTPLSKRNPVATHKNRLPEVSFDEPGRCSTPGRASWCSGLALLPLPACAPSRPSIWRWPPNAWVPLLPCTRL